MSLLNFKDWFHPQKNNPEAVNPIKPPEQIINLDQYRSEQHEKLGQNLAQAGIPVAPGSTIPPIETAPVVSLQAVNTDPMQVIMAGPQNANDTAKVVDIITPESFKSANNGAMGQAVGNTFGNDAKETLEQYTTGKSYRITGPEEFMSKQKEREQARDAMKQQVAAEMKKAA